MTANHRVVDIVVPNRTPNSVKVALEIALQIRPSSRVSTSKAPP